MIGLCCSEPFLLEELLYFLFLNGAKMPLDASFPLSYDPQSFFTIHTYYILKFIDFYRSKIAKFVSR